MMGARDARPRAQIERGRVLLYIGEALCDRDEAERSLWSAVAFGRRCGLTWAQLAMVAECSVETVRRHVREIEGRAA